jgi:hypothetical protein
MGRGKPPSRLDIIDSLIDGARTAHRDSKDSEEHARVDRARRDVFIRRLYATGDFTYARLAEAINQAGCGAETVAKAVQHRARRFR